MVHAIHPQTRPLLTAPPAEKFWACGKCGHATTNHTEAIIHNEMCDKPAPTMREIETAAAKLVKMEADLAAAENHKSD